MKPQWVIRTDKKLGGKDAFQLSDFACVLFLTALAFLTACRSSDSHFAPVEESHGLAASVHASLNGKSAPPPDPRFSPPPEVVQGQSQTPGGLTKVTLDNQFNPAWLKPSPDLFTLGPGDRVELELLGEPGSRVVTLVAPDGKIYFNLLPGIDVWGLT